MKRALNKDPSNRYESVAELSKDISRHLGGTKIAAPKVSSAKRARTPTSFTKIPENSNALGVLPFNFLNLSGGDDTDDRFLGMGLADALITRLSKVRRFAVRPTGSILSLGDARMDAIRDGNELNVDYILDGNIKKPGNRLRVTVQLPGVAENAAVCATSIDEVLSDVLTLEDTLANKVIEVLLPQLIGNELEEFGKEALKIRRRSNTIYAAATISTGSPKTVSPKRSLVFTARSTPIRIMRTHSPVSPIITIGSGSSAYCRRRIASFPRSMRRRRRLSSMTICLRPTRTLVSHCTPEIMTGRGPNSLLGERSN